MNDKHRYSNLPAALRQLVNRRPTLQRHWYACEADMKLDRAKMAQERRDALILIDEIEAHPSTYTEAELSRMLGGSLDFDGEVVTYWSSTFERDYRQAVCIALGQIIFNVWGSLWGGPNRRDEGMRSRFVKSFGPGVTKRWLMTA